MLTLFIEIPEMFDEETYEFIEPKRVQLNLEHSLFSISKWEEKYKKPFLQKRQKTYEESLDYIKYMTLNKVDDEIYRYIKTEDFDIITKYIEDSRTATWFSDLEKEKQSRDIITSEVVYYLMVSLQIPFECQYWHLSRLLTLIRVINIKSGSSKKMSKSELMARNKALNEARKNKLGSKG